MLYNHICDILSVQTIAQDLRSALCQILKKVGIVYEVVTTNDAIVESKSANIYEWFYYDDVQAFQSKIPKSVTYLVKRERWIKNC